MFSKLLVALFLASSVQAARNYTRVLQVTNGGQWGDWKAAEFCPGEQFAIGYDIQVEPYQFTGDDTGLNSIALVCSDPNGAHVGTTITSGKGTWGDWKGRVTCNQYPSNPTFLVAYSLEVESPQGSLDDVAASWLKFECRDFQSTTSLEVLNKEPGTGTSGSFGPWSNACDAGTAVCGLATKVESNQGDGDDTALNDVKLYCCPAPSASAPAVGK